MRFAISPLLASSLRIQPPLARTSFIEALEDRQLLSITPANAVAPAADLVHIGDVGAPTAVAGKPRHPVAPPGQPA